MRFKLNILNTTIVGSLTMLRKPSVRTGGWSTRCQDGRSVLFFDFDGLNEKEVNWEIDYIQDKYKIGDVYIFECGHESYHGVCIEKFSLYEATTIIGDTSCDPAFKRAPYSYGKKRWILRMEEKNERPIPKYIYTKSGCENNRQVSTAHKIVLENYYDIPIGTFINKEDGYTTLDYCKYDTGSKIYKKDLKTNVRTKTKV